LGPSQAELKIIERINELHHREENYVASARIQWLAEGGQNTKFFPSPSEPKEEEYDKKTSESRTVSLHPMRRRWVT
jgi:hypothetical protein